MWPQAEVQGVRATGLQVQMSEMWPFLNKKCYFDHMRGNCHRVTKEMLFGPRGRDCLLLLEEMLFWPHLIIVPLLLKNEYDACQTAEPLYRGWNRYTTFRTFRCGKICGCKLEVFRQSFCCIRTQCYVYPISATATSQVMLPSARYQKKKTFASNIYVSLGF